MMPNRTRALRLAALASAAALATGAALAAAAATLVRPEEAVVALFALQVDLEVEQKILQREETRYESNIRQRADLRDRLARANDELEAVFLQERGGAPPDSRGDRDRPSEGELRAQVEAREDEVRALERLEGAVRDEARSIRDEIRRIRARIALLEQRTESLRASLPTDKDSVTGIWDVTLMPSGDRGVFALWQTGTIVSGQYVLDGPYRGSLEGTLVNRQVLLRRIDAKLGRSMELSGYISEDGRTVQGTWQNYDLSSGRSPTGSWSGRKRAAAPAEAGGAEAQP